MEIKIFNRDKFFQNSKAATILLITYNWVSIREASQYYKGLMNVRMEKDNPEKFLLKIEKEAPSFKNLIKKYGLDFYLLFRSKGKKRFNIWSLPKYTNPMVQKYILEFQKLGWVKKELKEKEFIRWSKNGKLHIYPDVKERFRINLPKILIDYITQFKKIKLTKEEERIVNYIFSIPKFSDYLIGDIHNALIKNTIPTIANFAEKVLFNYIYTAITSENPEDIEEAIKLLKQKRKRKDIFKNPIFNELSYSSLCFTTCFIATHFSSNLLPKLIDSLDTHLIEVIKDILYNKRDSILRVRIKNL
jgi:hypothetical protein